MRIVALLAAYNEERFIGGCLEHLAGQGVETYLIDNSSTDKTVEIAWSYLGNGLIDIETLPRTGDVHRWNVILQRKEELAASIEADWFMHADPDEIRLPPNRYQTLVEAFAEIDAQGYNAVNFLEFTFVPTRESPEHDHPDFQRTMRWYYPFTRDFPHQVKAWKKRPEPVELRPGGHRVRFPDLCLYPEPFKMRHYQFLSLEQARVKYLEKKKYDPETIRSKSFWRAWLVEERMGLPSESELNTYTSDEELSLARPRIRHVMEDWALPQEERVESNVSWGSARGPESRRSGTGATIGKDELLIVYPHAGHDLYKELAHRLISSRQEKGQKGELRSAAEVCDMDEGRMNGGSVAVIAPAQCYSRLPDRDLFSLRLSEARDRIAVFAESVETEWFKNQFQVPIDFHALIDIGFVSQREKLNDFGLPYFFLFNAPTRTEKQRIERMPASGREIPWALVGHNRGERAGLAHELTLKLDPQGFVFLPQPGVVVREDKGMIGPAGLDALLQKTRYYVWKSLHDFAYYESFRFREAMMSGAMPCKIEEQAGRWKASGIPGIFPSVEALAVAIQDEGFETMCGAAKEFYLSHGVLADHLEEALASA